MISKRTGLAALLAGCLLPALLLGGQIAQVHYEKATAYLNGCKLVVDGGGNLHVCYADKAGNDYRLYYAYSTNGGANWSTILLEDERSTPPIPTLAVTSDSTVYIAHLSKYNYLHLFKKKLGVQGTRTYDFSNVREVEHPTMILDEVSERGLIYFTTSCGKVIRSQAFNFSDLKEPDGWHDNSVAMSILPGAENFLSSCGGISNLYGDKAAIAGGYLCPSGVPEDNEPNPKFLHRRLDYGPWGNQPSTYWDYIEVTGYSGGHPSIGRQGPHGARAVSPGSAIRYRLCVTPWFCYESPSSGDAYLISSTGGDDVQTAYEEFPFVVWERHASSTRKLYYSLQDDKSDWEGWTTAARVTNFNNDTLERFPHTDVDWYNRKVYIMWTQHRIYEEDPVAHDTTVQIKAFTFVELGLDTIIVTKPAGGEVWWTGFYRTIKWERLIENVPDYTMIAYTANGDVENPTWIPIVDTVNYSPEEYVWFVGKDKYGHIYGSEGGDEKKSDKCYVKVALVWSDPNVYDYDISGKFTMVPMLYQMEEPSQITSLMSSGTGSNPWDVTTGKPILGYVEPSDTFDIPWEGYTFTSVDTMILQFSRDYGESYSNVAGGIAGDSSIVDTSYNDSTKTDTTFFWKFEDTLTWIVPTAPTNGGYLRLMAIDTASDTIYSEEYGPYYVMSPGGHQYATYSNQNIMDWNDDDDGIGLVYTAENPDTQGDYSIIYLESDEGLDFSAPDTIDEGAWPAFSGGACMWQNLAGDSLLYAYQSSGSSFSTPTTFAVVPQVDSNKYSPLGMLSENDTVHVLFKSAWAYVDGYSPNYGLSIIHAYFPENSLNNLTIDTVYDSSLVYASYLYEDDDIAPTLVKNGSTIYGAFNVHDSICCFSTITTSTVTNSLIGKGSRPHVAVSEGNITFTYLGKGDSTLIRLWRYVDDTVWIERDTFYLDDEVSFFTGDRGVLFGVHYKDTSLTDVYGYSPLAEDFLLQGYYTGYYAHPFVDDEADEFSWVVSYADYADDSGYTYLHTIRRPLYVSIPAVYLESDTKRSPFTICRDTIATYTDVVVDSGVDTLKYQIPCLDTNLNYSLMVEFYHEKDSTAELEITVGSNVDTVEVTPNEFAGYHDSIPSGTDTVNIKIKRLSSSSYTFVPVSRIIVRRRSDEGVYILGDVEEDPKPQPIPFCLYQPFPNPFGNAANICFSVPYATNVSLKVYDVSGRMVTNLVDGNVRAGVHELRWTGQDDLSRRCPAGVYFVRFKTDEYQASKKMVLIK